MAVELDRGARSWLEGVAHEAFTLLDQTQVEVWFTRDPTDGTRDARLAVHIGTQLVGRLDSQASAHLRSIMHAAAERDEDPWANAWLSGISADMPYVLEVALPDDGEQAP